MLFTKAAKHNVGHFLPCPSLSCTGLPVSAPVAVPVHSILVPEQVPPDGAAALDSAHHAGTADESSAMSMSEHLSGQPSAPASLPGTSPPVFDFERSSAALQNNSTHLISAPSSLLQAPAMHIAETALDSDSSDEMRADFNNLQAGCSCVAMFGVCVCGFQRRWEVEFKRARKCPHMGGQGLMDEEMCKTLVSMDVPKLIAPQAAELHPSDLNAALDWSCSSERRHVRFRFDGVLEIENNPVAAAPLPASDGGSSMPSTRVLPVPASWNSEALHVPVVSDDSGLRKIVQKLAHACNCLGARL